MSDIKYIIAAVDEEEADQDGEQRCCCSPRRPFPCLATVRYAAAGMVTVLAVTVISMVIRAVLRSEDIRLSVNNGYVAADILWTTTPSSPASTATAAATDDESSATQPGDRRRRRRTAVRLGDGVREISGDHAYYGRGFGVYPRTRPGCYLGCGPDFDDDGANPPPSAPATQQVTMKAATATNLRVILIVNNPGGRTKVDCNQTTVTISDAEDLTFIARLGLSNFTVPPQTTITLQKRVKITDRAVLNYIWDRHRGRSAFGVVLGVVSSVASYPLGKMTEPKTQSYVCRSVTLGLAQDETSSFDINQQGDCDAEEEETQLPAPAP